MQRRSRLRGLRLAEHLRWWSASRSCSSRASPQQTTTTRPHRCPAHACAVTHIYSCAVPQVHPIAFTQKYKGDLCASLRPLSNTCVVLGRCRNVPRKVTRARAGRLGTAPLRCLPSLAGQLLDPPPGQFPGVHECRLCVNAAAVVWVYAPAVLCGLARAVVCVKKLLCFKPGVGECTSCLRPWN